MTAVKLKNAIFIWLHFSFFVN